VLNPYVPRPIDRWAEVPLDGDLSVLDDAKILAPPDDPAQWPAWREQLQRWRADAARRIDYDGSRYGSEPGDCFVIDLAWLWDELLYDHDTQQFTVERYVEHARREFGGFDGVLLWHAYPIEGIDARTQFDFYRYVPELPTVVEDLQAHGLRVFVVVYPWEPYDAAEVADVVEWSGANGVFIDSLREGSPEVRKALDELRPGLTLEAESRVPLTRMHDHTMSWAQWYADSPVPGVMRAKWFERRHMLHHVRRWNRTHVEELQSAWLNGTGVMVWESVFGVWVGWSARDKSLLRSMRGVQRDYAAWLRSEQWTPLGDYAGGSVYASRWEHGDRPLWTVVNRGADFDGVWLDAEARPGWHWTELTTGAALTVEESDGRVRVGGSIPADGIAAVIATSAPTTAGGARLDPDPSFPARAAVRRPVTRTVADTVPHGWAAVDGGRHELVVHHRVRETGLYGEAPYVDEWKPLPPRLHHRGTRHRTVYTGRFAVQQLEVSNAEYGMFLSASGYRPARPERFTTLGDPDAPVTNVELADARAYAAWRGWRLPTEDEWQLAGESGLLRRRAPLVWNLTESEHTDGRTRFVILKGGSAFHNEGSDWYFDGGPQPPDISAKYLIAGAGIGRSPSIGFRCAVDLA
jgi:hypothetical protein